MGLSGADLPVWAVRIRRERELRGWSQADAVSALIAHGDRQMPSRDSVLRRWKAWEAGEHQPSEHYQRLLAATFGTVRRALFPMPRPDTSGELVAQTGMTTLDLAARLQASDADAATLQALEITVDRLCSEYPYVPAEQLVIDGREWLRRVVDLRNGRLTLAQHRDVLVLAGWLALLVGCVEYDAGDKGSAEVSRRAALSLGEESGHPDIQGWAHEMRAWFALTRGEFRSVIEASRGGRAAAGGHGVSVQLAAQQAKAWARLGDRRQVELALEDGRRLLERLPYPDNIANHFVVDPAKYDYYAMDAYRVLGENALADALANEVLRGATGPDGTEYAPMRCSEARITLGVVAAREGDLEAAVSNGIRSLQGERKSLPHLLMASRELVHALDRYADEPAARDYLDRLHSIG